MKIIKEPLLRSVDTRFKISEIISSLTYLKGRKSNFGGKCFIAYLESTMPNAWGLKHFEYR